MRARIVPLCMSVDDTGTIGVILGVYWGYIEIMENQRETAIKGLGLLIAIKRMPHNYSSRLPQGCLMVGLLFFCPVRLMLSE